MISFNSLKEIIRIYFRSLRIKNKSITIISDNCWSSFMYQSCKISYNSPFVGLFIFSPDYVELLKDLKFYLSKELTFINRNESKYNDQIHLDYPIGLLDNKIEIHFLHYKNEQEARMKWTRRCNRIDFDNMIVKFCDRDLCTPDLIYEFDKLNYENKVCFTAKPYPSYNSVIWLKEFQNDLYVTEEWKVSDKYYDFVKNANKIRKRK